MATPPKSNSVSANQRLVALANARHCTVACVAHQAGRHPESVYRAFRSPVPACPHCGRPQIEGLQGRRRETIESVARVLGVDPAELFRQGCEPEPPKAA